jgi:hypothetical protein
MLYAEKGRSTSHDVTGPYFSITPLSGVMFLRSAPLSPLELFATICKIEKYGFFVKLTEV